MTDSSIRFLEEKFCDTISNLENLMEEIKRDRHEVSIKLNSDEEVNVVQIVNQCNEYNKMINIVKSIIEVLDRIKPEELKLIYNKIVELSAYVEIEYPAYKRDMLYVKEIYSNFNEFKDKLIERKYSFTFEDLFNDEFERLDAINSLSADIVLNKKLLKKEQADNETSIQEVLERRDKIRDLEFLIKYLVLMLQNN